MSRKRYLVQVGCALVCVAVLGVAQPAAGAVTDKTIAGASISGTLEEAVEQVRTLTKVRIVVNWRTLSVNNVRRSTPVKVSVTKVTLGQLLDKILDTASAKGYPLAWFTEADTVYITSQRQALDRRVGRTTGTDVRPMPTPGAGRRGNAGGGGGVNFQDVPLEDVIGYFQQRTGLNFHVQWKALAISGIDKRTSVTLQVRGISVARALDLLCDQLSADQGRESAVYWLLERGVLTITTGSALNTRLTTRVIDVSDLLTIVPNFKGPRIELNTSDNMSGRDQGSSGNNGGLFDDLDGGGGGDGNDDREEEDPVEMRKKIRKTLQDIIVESIGIEMWREGGGKGNIRFLGNRMIISQTRLGFLLLRKSGVLH